jgi:hypothetical protein
MEVHANEQHTPVFAAKYAPEQSQHACHNCRRQRLKYDRSTLHCAKCIKRGQGCLGYGQLFRWQQGVASRGKLTGVTFADQVIGHETCSTSSSHTRPSPRDCDFGGAFIIPMDSLTDPLVQDLDRTSRSYLSYCESLEGGE